MSGVEVQDSAAVAAPSILVAGADPSGLHDALPPGVAVFAVTAVAADAVLLRDAAGRGVRLAEAPMLCLGLLAADEAGLALLRDARARFQAWSDHPFPAPALVPAKALDRQVGALLSATLVERLRAAAADTVRLSRELARLRAAHEELHNAFAAAEAFLGAADAQPCRLAFENLPAGDAVLDQAARFGALAQLLPVSNVGLSVVQLHLGDDAVPAPGCIAELRTVEDQVVHETWRLGTEQLRPGWLTLALRQGLHGMQRTPELRLMPVGEAAALPAFSLGPPQPLPAFRPRALAGAVEGRSLALRSWVGLPGVRPPSLERRPDTARRPGDAQVREIALSFAAFGAVEFVPGEWQPGFNPVHALPEVRGLLCHPPPSGFVLGRLPGLDAREASRISVHATVRNENSAPVEFALAFADLPGAAVMARLAGPEDEARDEPDEAYAWTGWRKVAAMESALLSLDAPRLASGQGDLFFATRMADGKINDFAWATFLNLRRTLLGDAAAVP